MFCDVDGEVEMRSKQEFSWREAKSKTGGRFAYRVEAPNRRGTADSTFSGWTTVLRGADAPWHDMAGFVDSVHL